MAVCGIDLRNVAVKILGIHFSYNEKIKDEESFYNISNISNLTFEGTVVIFKTLAISKIVFLALLTKIQYQVVKNLLWENCTPKKKT